MGAGKLSTSKKALVLRRKKNFDTVRKKGHPHKLVPAAGCTHTLAGAGYCDRTALFALVKYRVRQTDKICSSLSVLQEDVFWQKNKYFDKKPTFVCILKKPNWVPAEWCWRLRFESTMKYFVKISRNNNKISHCALRCSAISTIQRYSIWLLLNTNKCGLFFKRFFFCLKTSSWSTSKEEQISPVSQTLHVGKSEF